MRHHTNPWEQTVVEVDLVSGRTTRTPVFQDDLIHFVGGRGIAAKLLGDSIQKPTNAFSPDAPLIFSMGTLTGTSAPMSGRSGITFVSPATGLYGKANVGGHFGLYCKLNGVDYLVIRGAASCPVYLSIHDRDVEILDACALWGKGVRDTTRLLRSRHGNEANIACIGPAGENRCAIAAVMSSVYNAAARGGPGATMGSKNVKAVVVARPTGGLRVRDPGGFSQCVDEVRTALLADTMADSYYTYGTAASIELINEMGALPALNFQRGHLDGIEQLTSQYWNEKGLLTGRIGCASCIYSCHRFIELKEGRYSGAYSGGPEYETVSALGTGTGVRSLGAVHRANALCNDLGLDTISAGGVIQWAMETFERGLLDRNLVGDLDLRFGSEQALDTLPQLIARREGLGDILADGVKSASERIGGESWKWAIHTRGLEQSSVDTRRALGYALAFAVNPRGPDHLHTECIAEFGTTPEARALIARITGDAKYARSDVTERRAEIVRWHEDIYAVSDALGLCAFITTAAYGASPERCARLFSTATGFPANEESIMLAGRRIVTLERLINLRLGWHDDPGSYAPWRLTHEKQETLSESAVALNEETLGSMVRDYYRLHDWDPRTGIPRKETLTRLGLADGGPEET